VGHGGRHRFAGRRGAGPGRPDRADGGIRLGRETRTRFTQLVDFSSQLYCICPDRSRYPLAGIEQIASIPIFLVLTAAVGSCWGHTCAGMDCMDADFSVRRCICRDICVPVAVSDDAACPLRTHSPPHTHTHTHTPFCLPAPQPLSPSVAGNWATAASRVVGSVATALTADHLDLLDTIYLSMRLIMCQCRSMSLCLRARRPHCSLQHGACGSTHAVAC
jgi:hypothetical protein